MTNEEVFEKMETAIYALFDVTQELKRREWDTYDVRHLTRDVEDYRDNLKEQFKVEASRAAS